MSTDGVPEHVFPLRLSASDHIQPPFAVRFVYVLDAPALLEPSESWADHSAALGKSLADMLATFFPTLTAQAFREEGTGVLFLHNLGSRPALFAAAEMSGWAPDADATSDGNTASFPIADLDLSAVEAAEPATEPGQYHGSLVKAKATWCHDDAQKRSVVILMVSVHHEVCDAWASTNLVAWWGEYHRTGTLAQPSPHDPTLLYGEQREISADELDAMTMSKYTFSSMKQMTSETRAAGWVTPRLRVSNTRLAALQAKLNAEHPLGGGESYSKNDLLCAMVWRSMHRASRTTASSAFPATTAGTLPLGACLHVPMSIRGKLPGVGTRHFGNALVSTCPRVVSEDALLELTIAEAAALVHREVRRCSAPRYIRTAMDWATSKSTRGPGMYLPSLESVTCTNWVHLPLYRADFGELLTAGGAPLLATVMAHSPIPNLGRFVATPPGAAEPGIDVVISIINKATLEALLADPDFLPEHVGNALPDA
jgi:hypothetical protein